MQQINAPQPQTDREWLTLIHATVCEIKANLDHLKDQHTAEIQALGAKFDLQNGRLQRLELRWAQLAGGLLVVAFMATYAVWPLVRQLLKLAP